MNSRERILAAISHKNPDRIPLDGDFREDIWAKLESMMLAPSNTVQPDVPLENLLALYETAKDTKL